MAKKTAQPVKAQEEPRKPNVFSRFARYVEDSRAELRKVSWPSMADTRKATLAVVGFVAVMAVILGLFDLGLSAIIRSFLS